MLGDDNPANDTASGQFTVEAGVPGGPGGWDELAAMPAEPSGKPVKRGGWLVHGAGEDAVYAAKGYKTTDFYRYSISGNSWTGLSGMPYASHPVWSKKAPRKGSKGCYDGDRYVYVTQGNNSLGFWRYDTDSDAWSMLDDVPLGSRRKKVKGGTDMVYLEHGGEGYVYLLKGYRTGFYRYSVNSGDWEELAEAPVGTRAKWDKLSLIHI